MALLETSALDSTNVTLAFECIIKGKLKDLNFRNLQVADVVVKCRRKQSSSAANQT